MLVRLECLIPCARMADWRRQIQVRHPGDTRNNRAAALLASWEAEMSSLNGSPIHERLAKLWEAEEDCDGERDFFSVVVAEELRAVGFSSFPVNVRELLETIANRLDGAKAQVPLQRALSQGLDRSGRG